MYKNPKTYKGFEIRSHQWKMTGKMILWSVLAVGAIYLSAAVGLVWLRHGEIVSTVANGLWLSIRAADLDHFLYFLKGGVAIFQNTSWALFVCSPFLLLIIPILTYFKGVSIGETADLHLRGTEFASVKDLNRELKKEGKTNDKSIMLGEVAWPLEYEVQHAFIAGRAGSGKTTLLLDVLDKIRARGGKAIIHDLKGDYLPLYYDPSSDFILNPIDERCVRWSLTNEIATLADIESITHSLIQPTQSQDRFWTDAARDVLFSILFYAVKTGKNSNKDLWELVSKTEGQLLEIMQQAVDDGYTECRKALGYLQGDVKGSKVAADVIATMRQYTNCLLYFQDTDGDWRLKNWIEDGKPGFLYVVNYPQLQDTLRPILSLTVDLTAKYTLSLKENYSRRIYFILDEFPQLQRLPSLVNILAAGRSKGAAVVLSVQDVNQADALYGREKTGSITNNCNTTLSFQLGDPHSQDFMSRLFGEREILESDESISMGSADYRDGLSITRRRRTDRLVLGSELGTLPKFSFYLKMLHHDVVESEVSRKERTAMHPPIIEKTKYNIIPAAAEAEAEINV